MPQEESQAQNSEEEQVACEQEQVAPEGEQIVNKEDRVVSEEEQVVKQEDEEEEEEEEEKKLGAVSEIEEITPTRVRLTGYVPKEKIEEIFKENWQELSDQVQMRGFRKGRIPRKMLERRVGSKFQEELEKNLKDSLVQEVIKDNGLHAIGNPEFEKVELSEGEPFNFVFVVEIVPDFAIPPIEDIEIKEEKEPVTEEDVEKALDNLRNEKGTLEPIDAWPPKEGDMVVTKTKIMASGRLYRENEGYSFIVGTKSLFGLQIPELSEKLLAGERCFTSEIQVPESHQDEKLRARKARIEVEVKEVKRLMPAEVTDDWASQFQCKSVSDLKDKIRKELTQAREQEAKFKLGNSVMDKIAERVDFPLPESIVKRIEESEQKVEESSTEETGEKTEETGEKTEETGEKTEETGEKTAEGKQEHLLEKAFRLQVLIQRIAEAKKIEVSEEEIDGYLTGGRRISGRELLQLKRNLAGKGTLAKIESEMLTQKVYEFLAENCRVEKQEGEDSEGVVENSNPDNGEAFSNPGDSEAFSNIGEESTTCGEDNNEENRSMEDVEAKEKEE